MFKFKNVFFVSVILILFSCATLPRGKTYRDVAKTEFPKTTQAIESATQVSQTILPPPYNQILNVVENLALLGLGIFAIQKHRRISRIETVLNGNLNQTKVSSASQPPPA